MSMDPENIKQILAPHLKPAKSINILYPIYTHSNNKSFKISFKNKNYLLKFYFKNELKTELNLLKKLKNKSFCIHPEFVNYNEPTYALFPFIESKHLHEITCFQEIAPLSYQVGKVLAEIHNITFGNAGLFAADLSIAHPFPKGSSPYYEYICTHFHPQALAWKRLGDSQAKLFWKWIQDNQSLFPIIQSKSVLVHSDFKPENILVTANNQIKVIDFEFAHAGDPLIDFGILLRHEHLFPLDKEMFCKGYTEFGGQLEDNWVIRAQVTDSINLIQLLNNPLERPDLYEFLKNHIKSKLHA